MTFSKSIDLKKILLPVLAALLIAALAWTGLSWKPISVQADLPVSRLSLTPSYQVITARSSSLWPVGTLLDPASAAFSFAVKPQLKFVPVIQVEPLPQGPWTGQLKTVLTLQAVNETGAAYWSMPLQAVPDQTLTLQPGGNAAQPVGVDVESAYGRAVIISQELGFENAKLQLVAQFNVVVNGQLGSQPVSQALDTSLSFDMNQVSFSIPPTDQTASLTLTPVGGPSASALANLPGQALTAIQKNPVSLALDLLLFAALLIVALLMKPWRRRTAKSLVDHHRFREWITEGSVQTFGKIPVQVSNLEGLVDLAIDSDKRVIFDLLQKKYFVLDEQVVYSFDPSRAPSLARSRRQLGKFLLERNLVQADQLETALFYHQKTGLPLGESLMALGFIDEPTLYRSLAEQAEFRFIETIDLQANPEALERLTLKQAEVLMILPLEKQNDGRLTVACSDPGREKIRPALEEIFASEIELVIVPPSVIRAALRLTNP